MKKKATIAGVVICLLVGCVPSLIAALKDDDLFVRLDAAAAFGHIGLEAAPAIPALVQTLTNQHRGVRFN